VQQVEQGGPAVLLPQAGLGFALMPGERFRDRGGEVRGVTGPKSLQGPALIGRLDADQPVRGIDARLKRRANKSRSPAVADPEPVRARP
jgi:hypothetical protein